MLWRSPAPRASENAWQSRIVAWLDQQQRVIRYPIVHRAIVRATADQTPGAGWQKITSFNSVVEDELNSWNNSTKRFVVPKLDAMIFGRLILGVHVTASTGQPVDITVTRNGATPAAVLAGGATAVLPMETIGVAPFVSYRMTLVTHLYSDGPKSPLPTADYFEPWVNFPAGNGTVVGDPTTFFGFDLWRVEP